MGRPLPMGRGPHLSVSPCAPPSREVKETPQSVPIPSTRFWATNGGALAPNLCLGSGPLSARAAVLNVSVGLSLFSLRGKRDANEP